MAASGGPPMSAPLEVGGTSRRIVMIGTLSALFLAALDQTVVATAFPRIVGELDGLGLLPWVFTAYLLASTSIVPIAGKLGDQFGRKPLFLVAIAVFLGGSFASGAAQTMLQLVIFRGVQGIGGGMLFATAFAVVGDLYAPLERGRIQGLFAAMFGFSSVIGPSLGGWITESASWRWVFYVNVPVGIIAFATVWFGMPWVRPSGRRAKLDLPGAALLIGTLVPLLLALTWGGDRYAWGSPQVIGMLAASALGLPLFLLAERAAEEPVLPLHLFRNRTFVVTSAVVFLLGAGMFGAITMIPTFLQGVRGEGARAAGTWMTPLTLSLSASAVIGGQVMSRSGRYKRLVVASLLLMVVGMGLLSRVHAEMGLWPLIVDMIIVGVGIGMTMPIFTVIVQNALPFQFIGVATSSVQFFRQVGGTVGVAVFTGVMIHRFRDGVAEVASNAPLFAERADALLNRQGVEQLRTAYEASPSAGAPPFDAVLALTRVELADAIGLVFLIAAVVVAVGWVLSWWLPELELQSVSPAEQMQQMQRMGEQQGGGRGRAGCVGSRRRIDSGRCTKQSAPMARFAASITRC